MAAPVVLLDACVLYPAALRDIFMRLAVAGLCQVRWTELIHDEWTAAVLRERPDLTAARLQRTRHLMNVHAEDSCVTNFEWRITQIVLRDPNDRHVLAAAMETSADFLVTWNQKDFVGADTSGFMGQVVNPDDFLIMLHEGDPEGLRQVIAEARQCLKSPYLEEAEFLAVLRRQGLIRLCGLLETRGR